MPFFQIIHIIGYILLFVRCSTLNYWIYDSIYYYHPNLKIDHYHPHYDQ